MQQQASDDLDSNSIARSVLTGIQHEDFKSTSVDALMGMVQEGELPLQVLESLPGNLANGTLSLSGPSLPAS